MNHNRRSRLSLFLPLALLLLLTLTIHDYAQLAQAAQDISPAGKASAQMNAAGDHGLRLTLETPAFTVDKQGIVTAPGLTNATHEAGLPALPYYSTLIVVPPEADVQVQVDVQHLSQNKVGTVRPAPHGELILPEEEGDLQELPLSAPTLSAVPADPDLAVYTKNELYPGEAYRVSEPMYYRDLRLVRLELFPLRYNPVTQVMAHSSEMHVSVTFHGADSGPRHPAGGDATAYSAIAPHIINYEQAEQWRSLPHSNAAEPTRLPVGRAAFKIEVQADGIYELTYDALKAAGMDVDNVDPGSFEMLYQGQPVAYQFVGDNNAEFEAGDSIRFYGWAFDGPPLDQQYMTSNVFWLFAGGDASRIANAPPPGNPPQTTNYATSFTRQPENYYFATYTDRWHLFPNEPDVWYWERIRQPQSANPYTLTKTISTTNPVTDGSNAVITAEFTSYLDNGYTDVEMVLNGQESYSQRLPWSGNRNVNISTTLPISALNDGLNQVEFRFDRTFSQLWVYLNRITVDYQRQFVSNGDQLIFQDTGGPHTFEVGGFSQGDPSATLVWDITDRYQPQAITDVNVEGSTTYTYGFASSHSDATIIATHEGNVITNPPIEKYTPTNLDPAGGAEWVAISYGEFIPEVNRLADHRSNPQFGGLKTHVADIEEVTNQYGYGLPLPEAIRNYLRHALQTWPTAPRYLLLVGDATLDPRQFCQADDAQVCFWGKTEEPTYVVSDLLIADRFQGHIPIDYTFGLLAGDDLLPELSVGRIAAQTGTEVRNTVDKIKAYETLHLSPAPWQRNVLFLADNPDNGGDFCAANAQVGDHIPGSFVQNHLCIPDDPDNRFGHPRPEDVDAARDDFYDAVNGDGVTFINYRGHGAVQEWAHELSTVYTDGPGSVNEWSNAGKPAIILSMDCLDGHFAQPGRPGLAETLISLPDAATAGHWSSTGLGFDFEHNLLHYAFYDGLFVEGLTTAGDAIDYAKIAYEQTVYHDSQILSFAWQGDPAMQLMRPDLSLVKSTSQILVQPGDTVNYELALRNDGLHPAQTTVVDTLPIGLDFVTATATTTATVSVEDNILTIELDPALAWNDTATVYIETTVKEHSQSSALTNVATARSPGLDSNPVNNTSQVTSTFFSGNIYLPALRKQ
ncbi:MAG TPA: C25 family cysteine peptidase [Candidatus Sulfomarinibacteraceae bacterium]|nr:C25 family cysteine peptidase [Candidatus Sulfomarinibacteraceae bacterium]